VIDPVDQAAWEAAELAAAERCRSRDLSGRRSRRRTETKVTVSRGARPVVFRDRFAPSAFRAEVRVDGSPVVATLWVSVDDEHGATCDRLELRTVSQEPLTAVAVRSVRLAELIRAAVGAASHLVRVRPDGRYELAAMTAADAYTLRHEVLARRPRSVAVSREELEQVAAIYNAARDAGRPPLLAVMEERNLSRSTASRLIRRARAERPPLIPPARGGGRR